MSADVLQEVEQLFQSKGIPQIREAEAALRHQVSEKTQELRRVVGESYNDLIATADALVEISSCASEITHEVEGIRRDVKNLNERVQSARREPSKAAASTSYEAQFALGSRVKFLLDTPEAVWACLEEQDHLGAAARFLQASDLHRLLSEGSGGVRLGSRFPLLHHQWPTTRALRNEVWEHAVQHLTARCKAHMRGERAVGDRIGQDEAGPMLDPQGTAEILAALLLLRPLGGAELLKTLLKVVRGALESSLEALEGRGALEAEAEQSPEASVAPAIARLTTALYGAVLSTADALCVLPGVTAVSHVSAVLSRAAISLAADLPVSAALSTAEAEAWGAHLQAAQTRSAELGEAGVSLEAGAWLGECLDLLRRRAASTVLGRVGSCAELARVEAEARALCEAWRGRVAGRGSRGGGKGGEGSGRGGGKGGEGSGRGGGESNGDAGSGSSDAAPQVAVLDWRDVSQWALGRASNVWSAVWEDALAARAQAIVDAAFGRAEQGFLEGADVLLAAVQARQEAAPGGAGVGQAVWASPGTETFDPDEPPSGCFAPGTPPQGEAAEGPAPPAPLPQLQDDVSWLAAADAQVALLDSQLWAAVEGSLRGAGAGDKARARRAGVQRRCAQALEEAAQGLAARLAGGEKDGREAALAPPLRGLVLGRLAGGLARRLPAAAVARGELERPRERRRGSASELRASGEMRSEGCPAARLPALQLAQTVAEKGSAAWARWAAEALGAHLESALRADPVLRRAERARGWEEQVVGESDAGGASDAEPVSFSLPASPSPGLARVLAAAARELRRAGGVRAEESAAQGLRQAVLEEVVAAVDRSQRALLGEAGAPAPEGAALQLLFDLRLAARVLARGGGAALAAAEAALSQRLDPIDWATYEPHLGGAVDRCFARGHLLLGLLVDWSARGASASGPRASSASSGPLRESNLLAPGRAPPARMAYLPVGMPAALRRRSAPEEGAEEEPEQLFADGDGSAVHFSFAHIALAAPPEDAVDVEALEPAAVAAAQVGGGAGGQAAAMGQAALEALRQSKLGSLLGERGFLGGFGWKAEAQ